MHRVSDERSRSSSAIRRSIRAVQLPDSRAQSARTGTRLPGSRATSVAISSRERPDLLRKHDERNAPQHRTREATVPGAGAF